MTYSPFVVERFGGLNLADDPQEIGAEQAQDAMNVEFDNLGRVKTRRGFTRFEAGATPQYIGLAPSGDFLLATDTSASSTRTDVVALDSSGATVASGINVSTLTGNPTLTSWATLGTPTATSTYIAFASSHTGAGNSLVKFDNATTLSQPGIGKPRFVASWQNRLVQGRFSAAGNTPSGSNGSVSTVYFSDAGTPETYSTNNYIHLQPGDGEEIQGILTWRELLFVFKETSMFVFYGTTTAGTGDPIFNYRKVDLGCRLPNRVFTSQSFPVCVGRDAIYISAVEGVYRTTGDVPSKMSQAIDPLFDGTLSPQVFWGDERLLVKGTTAYPWLVWDINTNKWTAWDIPLLAAVGWQAGTTQLRERLFFTVPISTADGRFSNTISHVYSMDTTATSDNGTAIAARYQSGVYNVSEPGKVAYTRDTRATGTGIPTLSVFTDYGTTDSNAAAVTLGTTAPAEGWHQTAYSGQRFSHKLSSTSGVWSVSSLIHDVAWTRP